MLQGDSPSLSPSSGIPGEVRVPPHQVSGPERQADLPKVPGGPGQGRFLGAYAQIQGSESLASEEFATIAPPQFM